MSERGNTNWTIGAELTAPAANQVLVQVPVGQGYKAKIKGFWFTTTDSVGNTLKISWRNNGVEKTQKIIIKGDGTIYLTEDIALNEGYPADPQTNITISNVTEGTAAKTYQASLLVQEVPL